MKTCNQCGGLIFTEQLEQIAGKLCKCNGHVNSPSLDAAVEKIAMTISKVVAGTSDSILFNASAILIREHIQPLFDALVKERDEWKQEAEYNAKVCVNRREDLADLRAQLATERAEKAVLRVALQGLFDLIESGDLVRNITEDGNTMTFLKQGIKITSALATVSSALTTTGQDFLSYNRKIGDC